MRVRRNTQVECVRLLDDGQISLLPGGVDDYLAHFDEICDTEAFFIPADSMSRIACSTVTRGRAWPRRHQP